MERKATCRNWSDRISALARSTGRGTFLIDPERQAVLPVNPATKGALTRNWTNKAVKGDPGSSKEVHRITEWWKQWPNACVGLRTGRINGIAVVDVYRHVHSDGFRTRTAPRNRSHTRSKSGSRVPMLSPSPSAYGMRRPASSPPALPRRATPIPRRAASSSRQLRRPWRLRSAASSTRGF